MQDVSRYDAGTVGELAALCVKGKRETSSTKNNYAHKAYPETVSVNATHKSIELNVGKFLQSFLL